MGKKLLIVFICVSMALLVSGCSLGGLPKSNTAQYRWMSLYLPWLKDSMLSGIGGAHVKPSSENEINLDTCGGYVLYMAFGSNMYNCYAVLRLDSRGQAVACYQDVNTRKYMQKSFTVQHETMKKLQRVLVKNGAGEFAESYVDTKITEGTQGGFTLLTRKGVRRSYFSNEWPSEFRNIAVFLQDNVLLYKNSGANPGFVSVRGSIIEDDPEATKSVRGLVRE